MRRNRAPWRSPARRLVLLGLCLASWCGPSAPALEAEDAASVGIPLPLDKTTILRPADKPYVIDGARVIGPAVEITIERQVRILGINGASLDVQGGFKAHGTRDNWVKIEKVDFSPTKDSKKGIHLDCCDLTGCKFKHGEGQSFRGQLNIENSCLQRDCEFDVLVTAGFVKLMTVEWGMACRIRCERQKENPVPVEVELRSSWMREVFVTGPAVVNLRHSQVLGLEMRNVTEVMVDGCDLGQRIAFLQGAEDSYGKVTLQNCNVFTGGVLVFERPQGPKTKLERVKLEKFFFGPKGGAGITADKDVAALITDAEDDPKQAIRAWWSKPKEHNHQLVNYGTLRMQVPELRR